MDENIRLRKELEAILEERRSGLTREQNAVVDAFLETEEHVSARDLAGSLKAAGREVPETVVRHVLDLLSQYGIAKARRFNPGEVLYEHGHLGRHHDHLICLRCDRIEEIEEPAVDDNIGSAAVGAGFRPLRHMLNIYGVCAECRDKESPVMPLSMAGVGETVKLTEVRGGDGIRRKLEAMGLVPGVELKVINNQGPIVIGVRDSRIALGWGLSQNIEVTLKRE